MKRVATDRQTSRGRKSFFAFFFKVCVTRRLLTSEQVYSRSSRFVTCPALCCSHAITPTVLILTAEASSWPHKEIKISYLQAEDCCFFSLCYSTRSTTSRYSYHLGDSSIIVRVPIRKTENYFSVDISTIFRPTPAKFWGCNRGLDGIASLDTHSNSPACNKWVISKVLHTVRFLFQNEFILQNTFTVLQCNLHCALSQRSNVWASLVFLSGRLLC